MEVPSTQIRPLYSELQGYLTQAPSPGDCQTYDSGVWESYHAAILELAHMTGKSYERYMVGVEQNECGSSYVRVAEYRTKISGLIARLHGQFFPGEPAPFAGMPNTVITQNQQQTQVQHIQMLLELQSQVDAKLNDPTIDANQKSFLGKVKESLASVRNVTDLLSSVVRAARDCGMSTEQLADLFN